MICPRQVRGKFGEQFKARFWPIFQAFNTVLPAHAPEPESNDSLRRFMGGPP